MTATHDDYINMRLLVDVAEATNDDVALRKLAEYVETIEALDRARGNARSKLPIKPLRIADCLPALGSLRGGIKFYDPTQDFSAEAERLARRRDAVIGLFRTINEIQWGNGVNNITAGHLDVIQDALTVADAYFPAEQETP